MGVGSSSSHNPTSSSSRRGGPHHRHHGYNSQKSSWTQAHMVSSRPAAPTNLNVNRTLGSALSSTSSGQRRHHHPKTSTTTTTPKVTPSIHHRTPSAPKSAAFLQTGQSVTVLQVNVNNTQKHQPKSSAKSGGGGAKPKIDYRNTECTVCGHTGHSPERCHHRHNSCHICHEPGHLASVCTQKTHNVGSRYRPREGRF